MDEIIASLIDEARRVGQDKKNITSTALSAQKNPKSKPICIHCGKVHKSENFWQKYPEKRPGARYSSTPENSLNTDSSQPSNGVAFLSQKNIEKSDSWILDSGATQHMCNDKSQFLNFEPSSTTITIANNSKMDGAGRGDIKITKKKENLSHFLMSYMYHNLHQISCLYVVPWKI